MVDFLADGGKEILNRTYPDWRENSCMFPAIFTCRRHRRRAFCLKNAGQKPSGGKLLDLDDEADKTIEGQVRGEDAEAQVFAEVERYGLNHGKPLVAFRSVKINGTIRGVLEEQCPNIALPFAETDPNGRGKDTEIDLLCLHPSAGLIIVEVKGAHEPTRPRNVCQRIKDLASDSGRMSYRLEFVKRIVSYVLGPSIDQIAFSQAIIFPFLPVDQDNSTVSALRQKNVSVLGKGDHVLNLFNSQNAEIPSEMLQKLTSVLVKIVDISCPITRFANAIRNESRLMVIQDFKATSDHATNVNLQRKKANDHFEKSLNIKCLTPEQLNAWHGPEHQLIRGHAGTGKTSLLMARVNYLAQIKTRVVVYAREPSYLLYSQHVEKMHESAAALVECKPYQHLRSDHADQFALIANLHRSGQRFDQIFQEINRKFNSSCETRRTEESCALILDDIGVESQETAELEAQMFVAAAIITGRFQSVWACADFAADIGLFLMQNAPDKVMKLQTVVRHSRNVYQSYTKASFLGCEAETFIDSMQSFIGHRCFGLTTRHFDVNFSNNRDAAATARDVTKIIAGQLKALSVDNQTLTLQNVVVLVDKGFSPVSMVDILRLELEKAIGSVSDIGQQILAIDNFTLAVDSTENSHSIERDVVFYVKSGSFEEVTRQDQLAITRCITALITISVMTNNSI